MTDQDLVHELRVLHQQIDETQEREKVYDHMRFELEGMSQFLLEYVILDENEARDMRIIRDYLELAKTYLLCGAVDAGSQVRNMKARLLEIGHGQEF